MVAPALVKLVGKFDHEIVHLRRQVTWFQRQIFGQKSERRLPLHDPEQGVLGEDFAGVLDVVPASKTPVAGHERETKSGRGQTAADESTLFFDETKVPVETIAVPNPDITGLTPAQYEVIGEKVSHRLAQPPGSYVVLKYVRPVIKRSDTHVVPCPPAPVGMLDGSQADISFIAGMMVDKLALHLPLYRQHQRLRDAGIQVSRAWLTQLMQRAVMLLEPIHDAQMTSIRTSRVLAMDEIPIKAGPTGIGKMKVAYFWSVYGQ
jgi:transposase